MTPELHQRAGEIFDHACELSGEARQIYLGAACSSDIALRSYVESLLAHDDTNKPDSFLAEPVISIGARLIKQRLAPHSFRELSGMLLGNYEIGRQIGQGGMGTVYQARDLRLNRLVAFKALSSAFVPDEERIRRFRQESRAVALLNHPNIVSIFEAGSDQGIDYIATELVEGKTLRELTVERPLDVRQLLDVASQTAAALSSAHSAGIVHRDIKPENIMVRSDGFVKVLDFGLAKLIDPGRPDNITRQGLIAGTVYYLSPEQALGKDVDPRSDLFSLGIVLYELATGQRPFTGATQSAVVDSILHHVPRPPAHLRPQIYPDLSALICRLLEREPEFRFQTATDLQSSLKRLARDTQSGVVPKIEPFSLRLPPVALGGFRRLLVPTALLLSAGILSFLVVFTWAKFSSGESSPLPIKFERLTTTPGEELFPNLSANGSQFLYSANRSGHSDIYLQRTSGMTALNLTSDSRDDNTQPSLSHRNGKIVFRSERNSGGLFVMEATGENITRVSARGYLPAWSPDGRLIVYCDQTFSEPSARGEPVSRLHIVELATGQERQLKTADAVQPNWSPHGYRIAYWGITTGGRRDIFTVGATPADGEIMPVTDDPALDWNPVWSANGKFLYFLSDRGGLLNLWRVAIDEKSGRLQGKPEPVTLPSPRVGSFNFSADGSAIIFAQTERAYHLDSVPYDSLRQATTAKPEPVVSRTQYITNFSFSPDGKQVAYDSRGSPQEGIGVMNRDGSGQRVLIADSAKNRAPDWSPVNDEIAFFSDRSGRFEIWLIHSDGSGLRQLTQTAGSQMQAPQWAHDGLRIFSTRQDGTAVSIPVGQGLVRNPEALPIQANVASSLFPSSPNGTRVAINVNSGAAIILYNVIEKKGEMLPYTGYRPCWLPDGSGLLYSRRSKYFRYDFKTRTEKPLFDVSPDRIYATGFANGRIYFTRTTTDGNLWIAHLDKE